MYYVSAAPVAFPDVLINYNESNAAQSIPPNMPRHFVQCQRLMIVILLLAGGGPVGAQTDTMRTTHAEVIRSLDAKTLARGEDIYQSRCTSCHGKDGTPALPAARSFRSEQPRHGADPYSLWKTITRGTGQMPAQTWLSPEERYYVIQYIREELIRPNNPSAYEKVSEAYLKKLSSMELLEAADEETLVDRARRGDQSAGQAWAQSHPGDYGPAVYSQLRGRANAALTVKLTDSLRISYDLHRMSVAGVWLGRLDISRTKHVRYRGEGQPRIEGREVDGLGRMQWNYRGQRELLDKLVSRRSPLPDRWLTYHGHYQDGEEVVLSYSIMGRKMLEMPSAVRLEGQPVLQHTLSIEAGESPRRLEVGGLGTSDEELLIKGSVPLDSAALNGQRSAPGQTTPSGSLVVAASGAAGRIDRFVAAGIQGAAGGFRWEVDEGQLVLFVPPSTDMQTVRIHRYSGEGAAALAAFASYMDARRERAVPGLADRTAGGERTWDETVITEGKLEVGGPRYNPIHYEKKNRRAPEHLVSIPDHYPYVVDEIALPFDNPWNSWIRPSALDFFRDGRLVMATYPGDVWIARGVDGDLEEIRWQRVAAGLFEPFGITVRNGEIYVTCRDRIVQLKDLDGDGETDFYKSFFADTDVSSFFHSFNFGLQTDSEGNFYYTKPGQYTNNDEPGNLIKVSADGDTQESIATGFRTPNGVTVGPDDRIYVSDNQGNWMPANKISLVEDGGFYGYVPSIRREAWGPGPKEYQMRRERARYPSNAPAVPDTFDQPIVWMPQAFDSSPGGGAWTPESWGPLGGRLVQTSFGKGWVYYLMMQEIDGVVQGAVTALPFQFDSGIQRARVNPSDGQFYVAGLTGWGEEAAVKYGSLNRIRYVGGTGFFIDDVNVRPRGIEIRFNRAVDADMARRTDRYSLERWNYRWQERYGSVHYSVQNPGVEGHDEVPVRSVAVEDGGKTVVLELTDLRPADQMRLRLTANSAGGHQLEKTVYLTIHRVPQRQTTNPSPGDSADR